MKKIIGIIIVIVCVILAGFAGLQWRSYQKMQDAYTEGLLYFEEEDYEKSVEIFQKASSTSSLFGQTTKEAILGFEAESYYKLGKYEEAIAVYDSLIQANPESTVYYTMKSTCYSEAGKTEEAKEVLNTGWEKTEDFVLLEKLCDVSLSENDSESAIAYLDIGLAKAQELEDDEKIKSFLFSKIVVYEKTQDYDSAWENVKEFCEKYPDDEQGQKEYIFLSTRV